MVYCFSVLIKACLRVTCHADSVPFFLSCLGVVCCPSVLFKGCLRACRQHTFFLGLLGSGVSQRFIASLAGGFVHAKH